MSPSLVFNAQRSEAPSTGDSLERETWATLRIEVAGHCATDFWDRRAERVAHAIHVPAFPLAQWMVANWWSLLYEPCGAESPPAENRPWSPAERLWTHRHCLRSAESGLFLPYLHLYGNGHGVTVAWSMDAPDSYASMPGYYLESGLTSIPTQDAMAGLGGFVNLALGWCGGLHDPRVIRLAADWQAIQQADPEEQAFCRSAGRMGLDPYAVAEWEPGLADFLDSGIGGRVDDALVADLLESVGQTSPIEAWRWVERTERELRLGAGMAKASIPSRAFSTPKDEGYGLARKLRKSLGIDVKDAIESVFEAGGAFAQAPMTFTPHNHMPNRKVLAAVGWRDGGAIVAGPMMARETSARFLQSRGLYQALVGCASGARLITKAHTWDQQAARAFAAEFLAPQEALVQDVDADMDPDEREQAQAELAERYKVSTEVVRLQLQNHGVWRDSAA